MRKQPTSHTPVALRFRRWSRKGYAAFISVQHTVTIGQLSANVSERFQVKNGAIHSSVLTFDKVEEGKAEEEENTGRPDSPGSLSLLIQPTINPVRSARRPAASYAPIVTDYISENRGRSRLQAEGLPRFPFT